MIIASNNKGKINEIKKILTGYEIYSMKDKNIFIDVAEDCDTFVGNALKKAKEIFKITNEPTLADDSGLCIDVFDGWPGVYTHRFLGESATNIERNEAILEKMKGLTDDKRNAKVVCSIVYYDGNDDSIVEASGCILGKISTSRRGTNGFGFDEIFELEDGRTLAELPIEEKNTISARYLALMDLKQKLNKNNI